MRDLIYRWAWTLERLKLARELHPLRLRYEQAAHETLQYISGHMPEAQGFVTPNELMDFALDAALPGGYALEFGVASGKTLRQIVAKRRWAVDGFDSFEGLPRAWNGLPAGHFRRQRIPRVAGARIHKGLFAETLPRWASQFQGRIAFIHFDCDLYESHQDALRVLRERLKPGLIVLFDEYFNYPGWQREAFRAWQEAVAEFSLRYEYLGYSRYQVAIKVTGHD